MPGTDEAERGPEVETPPQERGFTHRLDALGPLDGRYGHRMEDLAAIFSERGLMQARVEMEIDYLVALSRHPEIGVRRFSDPELRALDELREVSLEDAQLIKDYEMRGVGAVKKTNHDVKSVEYFLRDRLQDTSLADSLEWIHFGLTSEDVNNIAYGQMLRRGIDRVILPAADDLMADLEERALEYAPLPMLSRTHGQPATPTTSGKEFRVYLERMNRQTDQLARREYLVKLNGASGNWAAHRAAYPDVDWPSFSEVFIERLNDGHSSALKANMVTTQIEPHDTYAELFHSIERVNTIIVDFDQDMWRYISDGWIKQKPKEGEVGSSAMPHKVNPIDFEQSEGAAGYSSAMCDFFATKLPVSRLQRDLSDSIVERNFGQALGYTLLALDSARRGLGKCAVDETRVRGVLTAHPEVLTEGVQTILREAGVSRPYELLKDLSRGKELTMEGLADFIQTLDVPLEVKSRLLALTPETYTGYAAEIAAGDRPLGQSSQVPY